MQTHRSMLMPVYLPTFLLAFSQGLTVYTLPLYAKALGGNLTLVGVAVAAAGIGTLLCDLPAGMLLSRFGRNRVMMAGTGSTAVAAIGIALIHTMPALVALRLVAGAGSALWSLSRMAYVSDVAAPAQRGRILSTFGGVNRAGSFAGPVIGGLVAQRFDLASPFLVAGLMGVLATILSSRVSGERPGKHVVSSGRAMRWHVVYQLLRTQWRELLTAGSAQVFAQIIRAGRSLIVPLYASSTLGLDVAVIGVIGSISAAIDMLMFLPAGLLMDRFGRKFASVPSFILLAAGMALIPLTHNAPQLIAVTILMGLGNGIGSGSMMTLGTDLAPRTALGEFLGLWRLIGDGGNSTGPLLVGGIAAAVGIGMAAVVLSGIGFLAACTLILFVRETLHYQATFNQAAESPRGG